MGPTRALRSTVLALGGVALLTAPAQGFRECRKDAVRVGTVCVDKYEASVWEIPADKKTLIAAVQNGNITSTTFLTDADAIQHGTTFDSYGNDCPDTGNDCKNFYAVSLKGVTPSRFITWFQAAAACRNSGKRLPTNQEWQVAAMGTPDPVGGGFCALTFLVATGAASDCVSDTGAFDMVGNVLEWVADWGDVRNTGCTNWPVTYGFDRSCVGGDGSDNLPGALLRGGQFVDGLEAGVFAVDSSAPSYSGPGLIGFRCAREP